MEIVNARTYEPRQARRVSFKRFMDIAVSSFLLAVTAPALIAIALVIRLTSKGPVLFRHKRVGLGGREFYIYKFRTMRHNAELLKQSFTPEQQAEFEATFKLKRDPRVTKIGGLLRKTSFDELPQFFNVLKGEMSIVGPRPVTKEELEKYGEHTPLLLSANPGITGLWQISGRSELSYEERVRLDIEYVSRRCFLLDLKIFLNTFRIVATRLGAY